MNLHLKRVVSALAFSGLLLLSLYLFFPQLLAFSLFDADPANRWVKYHQPLFLDWRRQQHSGIAYDSRRGKLYLFGSDTHGRNWDNSVHEFDLETKSWSTHYPPAPLDSYRADEKGRAVAGTGTITPWAMHTFDNIVYDPELDAIVVTALPEHNRAAKKRVPQAQIHPTWIYRIATKRWEIFDNDNQPYPKFFAAASSYDSSRNTIVAYKYGIWELGPERRVWQRANPEKHHKIHFNMAYDSVNQKMAVFGDHRNTNQVWVYSPGHAPGKPGSWELKKPSGDQVPQDQHFPVAFDPNNAVFLLVPDNRPPKTAGSKVKKKPASSSTFLYDLARNRYTKLPEADLPPLGMNYMMVYDTFSKRFLLVTGDHSAPPTLWSLKLDLKQL